MSLILLGLLSEYFRSGFVTTPLLAIAPAVAIPVAVGLGKALISGIGSWFSNKAQNTTQARIAAATNQANYDIAHMTNLFNAKEAEKQRQFERESQEYQNIWNLQQWQRQNEYNDPSSQVARLMRAGINPRIALVNSNLAGELQSAETNAVQPAHGVTAQMQPYNYEGFDYGAALGNIIESGLQGYQTGLSMQQQEIANRIGSVQAEYQITQIQGDLREQASRVAKNLSEAKVGSAQYNRLNAEYDQIMQQIDYFEETRGLMRQNLSNANELQQEEVETHRHQRFMAEESNEREWMRYKLEESLAASDIKLNSAKATECYAAAELARQEVTKLGQDIFEHGQMILLRQQKDSDGKTFYELSATAERQLERAKEAVGKLDKKQAEAILPTVVESIQRSLRMSRYNEDIVWYNKRIMEANNEITQQKASSILGSAIRYLFGSFLAYRS